MPIEIQMTKEIGNYEPKLIGPLTVRQTAAVAIAAPVCFLMFQMLSPFMPVDVVGFFMIIPAGLAYVVGWWRPYGMRGEKFLKSVIISSFIAPSKRKFIIKNYFDKTDEEFEALIKDPHAEETEEEQLLEKKRIEKSKQEIKRKKKYKLPSTAVK